MKKILQRIEMENKPLKSDVFDLPYIFILFFFLVVLVVLVVNSLLLKVKIKTTKNTTTRLNTAGGY